MVAALALSSPSSEQRLPSKGDFNSGLNDSHSLAQEVNLNKIINVKKKRHGKVSLLAGLVSGEWSQQVAKHKRENLIERLRRYDQQVLLCRG